MVAAHRMMYELQNGPIPAGVQLDHLCRNRACVNPAHLERVTSAENTRRGKVAKLTREQAEQIRRRKQSGESAASLAAELGVSARQVFRIVDGSRWRDEIPEGGIL